MEEKELRELILKGLPEAEVDCVDLVGDKNHWRVVVTSERFEGLSTLQQHRLVMDTLQLVMDETLHAIEIKTLTPQ
ncbi:MAG: BolA family transcriptional regulator [Planctomycetota bacterium]|nr:MAG: BolA family transcriptional regulator [Planctomycetota bacterium]